MQRIIGGILALGSALSAMEGRIPLKAQQGSYCKPTESCWPAEQEWQTLRAAVGGRLERPELPFAACITDSRSAACSAAIENLKDPYFIQESAGGTQSLGWLGAWTAVPSAYAIAAENTADVVAAVNFAREKRLRLVIKGTGHDYLGRSTAPDSLLVWTHKMRRIETHEAFVPLGCADAGVPAVSLGAGTRWLEAYQEVTVKHGRYVQGGGCTSVGAAGGFMQGGGFGSWSRKYGIAAASMLEAEVVTADGRVLVANRCQNQDLFWALSGGGGGTFGVVTRVTLMTHPLPDYFGGVVGVIKAKSDEAFLKLLRRFVDFYRRSLSNEHWGEKISVRRSNAIELSMFFEGFRATDAEEIWKPFRQWVERRPQSYTMTAQFFEVPGRKMWNESYFKHNFPNEIRTNPQLTPDVFWWAANQGEVATYWYAYESRWIPETLFSPPQAQRLAHVLFAASRHWPLEIAFNKGQAGAAADALRRDRETSMNPEVMRAGALVIIAARGGGHPAVRGHEPDIKEGEIEKAGVTAAMQVIRDATPRSGSYVNETNYFERDWKRGFWGDNYARLLAIKHKYDPDGIFLCHHCVGSDEPRVRPRE